MSALLKSQGVLSLQESAMGHKGDTSPDCLDQYYNLIISYGTLKGFDYSVGSKLQSICEKVDGFSKVKAYKTQYKTTPEIKRLLSARLDELESKFLQEELITKATYESLKDRVKTFFQSNQSDKVEVMRDQFHVLAYKE